MRIVTTAPRPFEDLLVSELELLGASNTRVSGALVSFEGDLHLAYRAVMYSRIANRVMMELAQATVSTVDDIYELAKGVEWEELLDPSMTLSVSYTGLGAGIRNTQFGARRIKDAVVDRFRTRGLGRPQVDRNDPDVSIVARFARDSLSLHLDLGGGSLHRRGYRSRHAAAPIKENLAAGLLMRAGWPRPDDGLLADPMCGSGTILLEAIAMACDVAPGLTRDPAGFGRWLGHDGEIWSSIRAEAQERRRMGEAESTHRFVGSDTDPRAVATARRSVESNGWSERASIHHGDGRDLRPAEPAGSGLLISNLPYGQRVETNESALRELYRTAGLEWRKYFASYRFALLVAQDSASKHLTLKVRKRHSVTNGSIPCWLLQGVLEPPSSRRSERESLREPIANRLRKNQRRLRRWAQREGIHAYRVYDADLPEYAVAVDRYVDWLHVQEYAPPSSIEPTVAEERFDDVMAVLPDALGVRPEQIVVKVRRRQRGRAQYDRAADTGQRMSVPEGHARLLVNLHDYLDTGLFLDHRPTRLRLADLCAGKSFLNLFCYTAAATVHAAVGGATTSVSVDLSKNYLRWAEDNLKLNGIEPEDAHRLVRASVPSFLRDHRDRYDVIFCDPPTFSNSKYTDDVFDVQRDHESLVDAAMRCLSPRGLLVFSTNARRFRLAEGLLERYLVKDVTAESIPEDFRRRAQIHRCFDVRHRDQA
ncbi:MAG: bifunctional 23S rRNA (guanine(2069)-N(7))-methyltransferase RlmK/23S rRNA (guanine(2445)-N(2))-methyltransferase RlmL [Myxococcota bacterium]